MEEWKEYKIGELCSSVCSGGTPSSKHSEYYDGNIPWLNTKEINFNRLYETEKYITEDGYNNSSAKWIVENSVIVAMYGATAGKTAIAKIPLTTNQACCNLTINPQIADYRFVYYHLCNKFVVLASLANGGAQQNLNAQIIKEFPISLPSLNEQKRIASILSSLDDKIEVNRKINENLEQEAQALFKSWFVDFEPFKNGEFVESELGMIPKGWRVEKIGNLPINVTDYVANGSFASLKENVKLYQTPEYAYFIRNTDLKSGNYEVYVDKHSYEFLSKSTLYGGEVIISNVGDVGSVHLCPYLDKPMTLGNNIIMLKPDKQYYSFFLYILFKWAYGNDLIMSIKGGSAQPKFNKTDFKSLKIIVPNDVVLEKYHSIISSLFNKIRVLDDESRRLAELRDTLLPKLMSGELKVNEIEGNL